MNKHIIELNGTRYDAISGLALSIDKAEAPAVKRPEDVTPSQPIAQSKPLSPRHGPNVDIKTGSRVNNSRRGASQTSKPNRPEHSRTLMRHAVHKPLALSLKRQTRVSSPVDTPAQKTLTPVLTKLSFETVDNNRVQHARHVAKSSLVKRFSDTAKQADFMPDPTATPAQVIVRSAQPQPVPLTRQTPVARQQPSLDIFERALAQATSHQQRPVAPAARASRSLSKRLVNVTVGTFAILLLGGFVAYQNMSGFTLRNASRKAGFAASLPDYRPAGFSIGKFAYSSGSVAVNFHSNSDSRSFNIIEKVSGWDSQSLLDNFVAEASGLAYHTVQASGQTIYLYGQNNATWVNNNVWYQIQTSGSLSSSQVIKLAGSI